jgi:hypothetical protein
MRHKLEYRQNLCKYMYCIDLQIRDSLVLHGVHIYYFVLRAGNPHILL